MKRPILGRRSMTVATAVRVARRDDARKLSPREVGELERIFVRAGSHAVRAHVGGAADAADLISAAKAQLHLARNYLAARTVPGDRSYFVNKEWKRFDAALRSHAAQLLTIPGVVGFGLGFRE